MDTFPPADHQRDHVIVSMPQPRYELPTTLSVPVRDLDARTLRRLDDHREPRPARWDYDALFESVD